MFIRNARLRSEKFPIVVFVVFLCLLGILTSVVLAKPKHTPGNKNPHNTAAMDPMGLAKGLQKNNALSFHNNGPAINPVVQAGPGFNAKGPKAPSMPAGGLANQPSYTGGSNPAGAVYAPTMVSNGIVVRTYPGKNLNHWRNGFTKQNQGKSQLMLGAGDAFSAACNFGDMCGSLEVPNPIGAKGPNPTHGGQHPKKGLGNPGGGNGNGHWGEGNQGNGKGNIWCGNQGHGVGEGMAGGCGGGGDNGGGDNGGGDNGGCDDGEEETVTSPAAPLWNDHKLEFSGCPALLQWAAGELGVPKGQIQVYMTNSLASSRDIQPCDLCARLQTAALILRDIQNRRVNALIAAIGEAADPDAPITPEQMAVIATALSNPEPESQYAAAAEYIEAAITYVHILTNEFDYTMEESMQLVSKYVGSIENETAANYVWVQIGQIQG